MLEAVSNKVDFPGLEEEILRFWEDRCIFRRSVDQRQGSPDFIFYDGPPFATGLPHYGHLLAGTIKDIVPRYQAMRGYRVERRFGWDCHGLPIEALAQEALGLSGAAAIREKGVDVFNETCRSMVLRYVAEWRKTVTRMGRWVDFDNDYKTMDASFMESVWWVFKQLWDQGRIYKSYRIMPYSWKLTTPLSNFEAGNNYKDVQDPAITVRLRVRAPVPTLEAAGPVYLLIWTTTPWTLPGNLAVCAGPDIDYAAVKDLSDGSVYLLAEARLGAYYKKPDQYERLATLKGRDLEGWIYEPIFPHFAAHPGAFRVLTDGFVSTGDGSGIVHMAPAYGEDDFRVCRAAGIDLVDTLDENAAFNDLVPEYRGVFCKDADKAIIKRLKTEGRLVHQTTLVHSYPFCERTDTPLIYRAIDSWYVRVEDLREDMARLNDGVHWVPSYVGEKRFGNWLRDAKDWNISRNRFWGSCLPVWVSEDGADRICVGSVAELESLCGQTITDLHKHTLDRIEFEKDGRRYRRTPEVLDCWFESGSMPYAQQHYPFERGGDLDRFFPAHFIAEGLDQTRGWFYTLLILSTALHGRSAYRNVVVNGLILAEDGRKMSKRLKNYPDPAHILNNYGADALRLYMINSPVVRAEDLCFSEEGVKQSLRNLLIPLWNAYSFFVTYARVDGWTPGAAGAPAPAHLLDRWILSSLERLTQEVVAAMDGYDLQKAVRPFVTFIDDLTNWYIRRSRRRFWKSEDDTDKASAYSTLYHVLLRLARIAAPFVPFVSEAIYRNLRTEDMPESVHLCDFPVSDGSGRDLALEEQMADVMTAVSIGRQVRVQRDLKIRQPLAGLHVVCSDDRRRNLVAGLKDIIAEELNVKNVWFSADEGSLAHLEAKPNLRVLGPRLGADLKKAAAVIGNLDTDHLRRILAGEKVAMPFGDGFLELGGDELLIRRIPKEGLAVGAEGDLLVALETELTPSLRMEGLAREFVNRVQTQRKTEDLEVVQRIRIVYDGDPDVAAALEANRDYIMRETLCLEMVRSGVEAGDAPEVDLNGHPGRFRIEKIQPAGH